MSMICNLRQVTDAQIDRLLANPDDITFFLYGPTPEPEPGFFARLFGRKKNDEADCSNRSGPPLPRTKKLIWIRPGMVCIICSPDPIGRGKSRYATWSPAEQQ